MAANPSAYTPRGFVETTMWNCMVNIANLASIADSDVLLDASVYRDRLRDIHRYCQQVINSLPLHVPLDAYQVDLTSLEQVPHRGSRGRRRQASRQHDDEACSSTITDDTDEPRQIEHVSPLTQLEDRGATNKRRRTQRRGARRS